MSSQWVLYTRAAKSLNVVSDDWTQCKRLAIRVPNDAFCCTAWIKDLPDALEVMAQNMVRWRTLETHLEEAIVIIARRWLDLFGKKLLGSSDQECAVDLDRISRIVVDWSTSNKVYKMRPPLKVKFAVGIDIYGEEDDLLSDFPKYRLDLRDLERPSDVPEEADDDSWLEETDDDDMPEETSRDDED